MNQETIKMTPREELEYYNKLLNGKTITQAKKILVEKDITINNYGDEDTDEYIDFETKWFTLTYIGFCKEVEKDIFQVWVGEDTYPSILEDLEERIIKEKIDPRDLNE